MRWWELWKSPCLQRSSGPAGRREGTWQLLPGRWWAERKTKSRLFSFSRWPTVTSRRRMKRDTCVTGWWRSTMIEVMGGATPITCSLLRELLATSVRAVMRAVTVFKGFCWPAVTTRPLPWNKHSRCETTGRPILRFTLHLYLLRAGLIGWWETLPVFGNLQCPQVATSCEPQLRAGAQGLLSSPEGKGIRNTFLVGVC